MTLNLALAWAGLSLYASSVAVPEEQPKTIDPQWAVKVISSYLRLTGPLGIWFASAPKINGRAQMVHELIEDAGFEIPNGVKFASEQFDSLARAALEHYRHYENAEALRASRQEVDAPSSLFLHPRVLHPQTDELFRDGHYADLVRYAARSVNHQLQRRVTRRDISDAKLVGESFSLKPPEPSQPRLRLMRNDGSDTYRSLHEGAAAFGRGCYMAIRNVLVHEHGPRAEPSRDKALEYLAAFSILATWIEESSVVRYRSTRADDR